MYTPQPIDTSHIRVPAEIAKLGEQLARNAHELWAQRRMADGWRYGPERDDARKEHPMLRPYDELPESEKAYDRLISMEAIKAMLALGFTLHRTSGAFFAGDDS